MKLTYRPEIDGLRAIAVLAVIIYHSTTSIFNYEIFKGGYIGVDIFFVISGYLITIIILNEYNLDKKFSFKHFYQRRIRRIIPVLLIVIMVSIPFGWLYLLPNNFSDYSKSIIYSLSFGSNFYFHYTGQLYGAENALFKPFLHTWSLSVEEQYYIFFPIILIFIIKFFNKNLITILILGFLISLFFANWASQNHPSFNFYIFFSRGWELLAGSILACREKTLGRRSNKKILKIIFPILGILIIFFSFVYFDEKTYHPSFFTIIPILGICLIIWFTGSNDPVTKILTSRLFVGTGLISYSLYLWHYPIFAFARHQHVFNDFNKVFFIIITIVLSIISYILIEKPLRNIKYSFNFVIKFIFICCLAIFITLFYLNHQNSKKIIKSGDDGIFASNTQLIGKGKNKFILFGDSHALHIMSYLNDISDSKNISFFNVTHTACISLPNITNINNPSEKRMINYKPREKCINLYKSVEKILREQVDEIPVVFYNTWFKNLIRNNTLNINDKLWFKKDLKHNEDLIKLMLDDIMYLRKKNNIKKKWILVGKNPGSYNNKYGGFLKCFNVNKKNAHQNFYDIENCEIKGKKENGEHYQNNLLLKNLIKKEKYNNDLIFIDSYDHLCDEEYCFNLDQNNKLIYKDHGHFTYEGSKILANVILKTILKINKNLN